MMPKYSSRPAKLSSAGFLVACLFSLLVSCGHLTEAPTTAKYGEIIKRGVLDCFEPGLVSADGAPVYCEASAIGFAGGQIVVASDKPVPGFGKSAVFSYSYDSNGALGKTPGYFTSDAFLRAEKYEDMTVTPDGSTVIATTGFDRIKSDSNEWDGFNTLLAWPVGYPEQVQIVEPTDHEGIISSVGLRARISGALVSEEFPEEVPYFKVESLAAIPGNRLLFGIRELGVRYDQFVYTFKIISVPYVLTEEKLKLGEFSLVYDFDIDALPGSQQADPGQQGTRPSPALSSIEYDAYHDQLYLLTSYEAEENDEGLGGYLWTLPLSALNTDHAPSPVLTESGGVLHFAHKAEGITVLSEHILMVIHDDDRVLGRQVVENPETQFSRQTHQAAYALVQIRGSN
jgi:hypothetical protein